jgi:hypothetical protein
VATDGESNARFEDILGKPVAVDAETLDGYTRDDEFTAVAFELYKEAGTLIGVCSHSFVGHDPKQQSLNRDHAICAGLGVRIAKFMISVMQLVSSNPDRGDVVHVLNRCITESAVNLRFLAAKDERRFYDQFVEYSLGPERELYDLINSNVKARGGMLLAIETRMLESIDRVCTLSGLRITDVKAKNPDWAGGFRNRLEALREGHTYVGMRVASHAVHGTWVDLTLHHLQEKNGGFAPDPSWSRVDTRLLLPVAVLVLQAAGEYVNRFLYASPDVTPLSERIAHTLARLKMVEDAHEAWLAKHG